MTTVGSNAPIAEKLEFNDSTFSILPTFAIPMTCKIVQVDLDVSNMSPHIAMINPDRSLPFSLVFNLSHYQLSTEFKLHRKVLLLPSDPIYELQGHSGYKKVHFHVDTSFAKVNNLRKMNLTVTALDVNIVDIIKVVIVELPAATTSESPQGSPQGKNKGNGASNKSIKKEKKKKNKK